MVLPQLGRIKVWFGLRTIFNNTDELITRTKELADKYGVGIHMHVAEIAEENVVLELASHRAKELVKRAGIVLPERFPVVKVR